MANIMATFKTSNNINIFSDSHRLLSSSFPFTIYSNFPNNLIAVKVPNTKLFSTPKFQLHLQAYSFGRRRAITTLVFAAMATGNVQEVLPPTLTSTSDPPPIFDGKTRLYIAYICPYAQRVWITRNFKSLQDNIELVPLDLQDRPAWYKEKVLSSNKVPALEHNNQVIAESLDLIKYLDTHFEGPSLSPDDPAKKEYAEELLSHSDSFNKSVFTSIKLGDLTEAVSALNHIESALSKFEDGPFFLGQFSLVDIAYIPFIERFQPFLLEVMKYDITEGRPKLKAWIEEVGKIEGYKPTRSDPKEIIASIKRRFSLPN